MYSNIDHFSKFGLKQDLIISHQLKGCISAVFYLRCVIRHLVHPPAKLSYYESMSYQD